MKQTFETYAIFDTSRFIFATTMLAPKDVLETIMEDDIWERRHPGISKKGLVLAKVTVEYDTQENKRKQKISSK